MVTICVLIFIGMLLLAAELVLLPGMSVAGIGALISCGAAIYKGFVSYGIIGGAITCCAVALMAVITVVICLKSKTWQRLSLKNEIDGTSQPTPQTEGVKIGDRGMTITRLAPMGKVMIDGKTFEAKSMDQYIDPKEEIEVTGFENFNVIVRKTN